MENSKGYLYAPERIKKKETLHLTEGEKRKIYKTLLFGDRNGADFGSNRLVFETLYLDPKKKWSFHWPPTDCAGAADDVDAIEVDSGWFGNGRRNNNTCGSGAWTI